MCVRGQCGVWGNLPCYRPSPRKSSDIAESRVQEHTTTPSSAPSDAQGEADSPQEDGTTEDDHANESDDQQHLVRQRSTRHEQAAARAGQENCNVTVPRASSE